ncbi:CBS domain-containing protein [Desulfofundulus thermobenzoicus]|uniref:CBS domain-containing protein n=1 Tax=Desulfofundulus thermobenzoicus TaxID=29376 RepID=A0A6N7ITE7_9FIRM|nr:CBS domain-containing protein [Desulfofundulus thermobenzoicus]MQL52799.1 CBS domain-containing protein [Desulfofundulus thermobenzoicus]HHW42443.1 CBS domain-containing protein [Desulfotomaculum sp.]
MTEKLVKEIMIPVSEYATVYSHDPLLKAIRVLRESFHRDEKGVVGGHRSVLVLDENNDLVGILTIRTILKAIEVQSIGPSWASLFAGPVIKSGLNMPVREVMRPVLKPSVRVNDTVTRAIHVLLRSQVNILPVMDQGKVVGIVRSIDFFEIIGEVLGNGEVKQWPGG